MAFNIEWEKKGVYIKFKGKIDIDEFLNANDHLYGKSEFDHAQYQLWDFSEVVDTYFDIEAAKIIGSLDKAAMRWNDTTKVAVLTDNPSIIDFVHKYQVEISGSNWTCEIFQDMDNAREWIK